jgi:hypothetical protein
MTQLTHHDTEVTQTSNTKKIRLRSRGWMITINNFESNDESNIKNIEPDKYIYQIEEGTNGTPHIQGFLYFKNVIEFSCIKRWFPRAHIEKANNNKDSILYCSKLESRVRGPYVHNIELPKKLNTINKLSNWQQEIVDIIDNEPDHRTIHWYYDLIGNTGKTSLCKYLCINRQDCIYINGSAKDMKYAVTNLKIKPKTILIDYARDQETHISWQGIEELKNGIFFNTKYESAMVIYETPHIICFANFIPQLTKLSVDRWNIINIQSKI